MEHRPRGVTIIAILAIIGGIFFVIGGLAPLGLVAFAPEISILLVGVGVFFS